MKLAVLLFLMSLIGFVNGQNLVKNTELGLEFVSSDKLEMYDTKGSSVVGYENKGYAIDILKETSTAQISMLANDLRNATKRLAGNMKFTQIEDGGENTFIPKSYFLIAHDKDLNGKSIPVVLVSLVNKDNTVAYKIVIYCYKGKRKEGIKIAKSFKFL